MKNILIITASIFGQDGQSSRLVSQTLTSSGRPTATSRPPIGSLRRAVPHLDAERFGAFLTNADDRDGSQQGVVDYSDLLISEVVDADVIVMVCRCTTSVYRRC
jgi:FMN-dependent NADH-azoreductase